MSILADVVAGERDIQVFRGLLRDIDSISKALEDVDSSVILLAPNNTAMTKEESKPWEMANDYQTLGSNAYDGVDGQALAQSNVRKFVEAHIVARGTLGVGEKVQTVAGTTVWIEEHDDGHKTLQPSNVNVSKVNVVGYSQLWIIDGVLATS